MRFITPDKAATIPVLVNVKPVINRLGKNYMILFEPQAYAFMKMAQPFSY
jgi:hypothetical protein